MSKTRREDNEETWGKSWDRTCKESEDGIEETGKKFQRGMSRLEEEE